MNFKQEKVVRLATLTAGIALFSLQALSLGGCRQDYFQTIPTHIDNFKGILVNGDTSSYQAQKGTATFIVLTASWCPGCRAELPQLQKLDSEFAGKGFRIILISEDDTPQEAANFNQRMNIPWTTFHWNYDMMNKLGNPGVIPVTYLVNAQDSIVKVDAGGFDEKEMKFLIKNLLEIKN